MQRDPEILSNLKPAPLTDREQELAARMDPVELTLFTSRMQAAVTEGLETVARMGSSVGGMAGDSGAGIYLPSGSMAICMVSMYGHATLESLYIKHIVKYWTDEPTVGIKDGDIFFANEAHYGGGHCPDMFICMPVFYKGELICWVAGTGHDLETGAIEPGGMPPTAKTRYDEGMRITPIKIGENFLLKEDIIHMMENMTQRDAGAITMNNKARLACCMRIRQRVIEMAEEKGADYITGGMARMVSESAEAARRRIAKWNDGTYRQVQFLDSTGREDKLIRCSFAIIKKGDHITFDFRGSSPQVDSIFNSPTHTAMAAFSIYLFTYPFSDLPPNSGPMAPFDFTVDQGSIFAPDLQVAACGASVPALEFVAAVQIMFSKMMFDSEERWISAAWADRQVVSLGAGMNQWGNFSVTGTAEINGGGQGARADMDGTDTAGPIFSPGADILDVEFFEREYPLFLLWRNKHLVDGHGFGKYRGGSGLDTCRGILNVPGYIMVQTLGSGGKYAGSPGLFGGYSAGPKPGIRVRNTNLLEMAKQSDKDIAYSTEELLLERKVNGEYVVGPLVIPATPVTPGDMWLFYIWGGGGYGDVLERDPELVMKDLGKQVLSHWAAQNVYHVAYDPVTLRVDYEATEELRQAERERRKQRGKPYEEFEKEWLKKKPKEEILTHYGTWPIPFAQG